MQADTALEFIEKVLREVLQLSIDLQLLMEKVFPVHRSRADGAHLGMPAI